MSELSYSDKDGIRFLLQTDLQRDVYLTFCNKKRYCSRVPVGTDPAQRLTKLAKEIVKEIRRIKRKVDDENVCFNDNHPFGD